MARPRRSEATRETLLVLGVKLFATQGYHGTGLKQILDEAGVPKGSFYNYFSSKENFCAETVVHYSDFLQQQIVQAEGETPVAKLLAIHRDLLAELQQQDAPSGCLLGSLASEIGAAQGQLQTAIGEGFATWNAQYVTLVEQAQAQGLLRNDLSATDLAHIYINQWHGAIEQYLLDRDGARVMTSMEQVLTILMRA
jgi:TetR/AcrR family transcriptional repressor of nem operon